MSSKPAIYIKVPRHGNNNLPDQLTQPNSASLKPCDFVGDHGTPPQYWYGPNTAAYGPLRVYGRTYDPVYGRPVAWQVAYGPILIRNDLYIRPSSSFLPSLALDSRYTGYQFIEFTCTTPAFILYIDRATTHTCSPIVYYKNKQAHLVAYLIEYYYASIINNYKITAAQIRSNKHLMFYNEISY